MNEATVARRRRVEWLAIVTYVLASLWLFGIGSLLALLAGRRSLRRMRADQELRGRMVAWAGIVVAITGLAMTVLWIAVLLAA